VDRVVEMNWSAVEKRVAITTTARHLCNAAQAADRLHPPPRNQRGARWTGADDRTWTDDLPITKRPYSSGLSIFQSF